MFTFGHNHLLGSDGKGKYCLTREAAECPLIMIFAPYALMNDAGDIVKFIHRVEYDIEQTIKSILNLTATHVNFGVVAWLCLNRLRYPNESILATCKRDR